LVLGGWVDSIVLNSIVAFAFTLLLFVISCFAGLLPIGAVDFTGSWVASFAGFLPVVAVDFAGSWVAGFADLLPVGAVDFAVSWVAGFADLLPVGARGFAGLWVAGFAGLLPIVAGGLLVYELPVLPNCCRLLPVLQVSLACSWVWGVRD